MNIVWKITQCDRLTAQIEAQKNPVTATGTPWGQA
jgi:hypothetical protein